MRDESLIAKSNAMTRIDERWLLQRKRWIIWNLRFFKFYKIHYQKKRTIAKEGDLLI
jgi:hypothetical protein